MVVERDVRDETVDARVRDDAGDPRAVERPRVHVEAGGVRALEQAFLFVDV